MKHLVFIVLFISMWSISYTQADLYLPKEYKRAYKNQTRSINGEPGKNYWQNHARYDLKVTLDPESKILKGEGEVVYYNNSPDSLRFLIVKLLPNIQKTGGVKDYTASPESLNEGMIINDIRINDKEWDLDSRRDCIFYGTNVYLMLNKIGKLAPGQSLNINVDWTYEVVKHGIRNGAYTDSSFFIGYWYPQIAVYDDVYRWDREDYTGKQETYNDTSTYLVEIKVPPDYLVWATGEQQNESAVFSSSTLNRIYTSRKSDKTVNIVSGEDYGNEDIFGSQHEGIWKFVATGVPDFAWATSNYYMWDANSASLKNKAKSVWVNAAYPPGTKTFDKVADVANESIRYCSEVFPGIPYPFFKHITFNGINYIGVEYPMIANNGDHASREMYTELTIHEIAHNYIPFYMLSNERKHAWIDEGWVKLIGEMHGEKHGIKREDKHELNTIQVYEQSAGGSNDLPLIVPSGFMTTRDNFYHSYAKACNSNVFLLELLKEKGVDNPLKQFLISWEGKHPTPYDFFNFMNASCDKDLSWFWKPWYFEFSYPDQQLVYLEEKDKVMVSNPGGIPLPVKLTLTYEDGTNSVMHKSIWEWSNGESFILVDIPEIDKVVEIELGSRNIPDIDRTNNLLIL